MMHATTTTHATTRRWRVPGLRPLVALAAVGMLLAHAGDRGQAQSVSSGIDPLEVLNLLVRPNVLVVLDSSGSMAQTLSNQPLAGDHPASKMFQAKDVLETVIAENQDSISFQLAQYTQPVLETDEDDRWEYVADSATNPSLLTTALFANVRICLDISNNGENNDLEWSEDGTSLEFNINGGGSSNWDRPGDLALDIQTRMNATSLGNTYAVTWDPQTQGFTFAKTAGGRSFVLELDDWTRDLGNDLGFRDGGNDGEPARTCATAGGTGSCTSDFAVFSCGGGDDAQFIHGDLRDHATDPDGVEYHRIITQRFFNGERFQVLADGTPCGAPSSGTPDSTSPYIELELRDPDCSTSSGTIVRYDFAGARASSWDNISGDSTNSCGGQQTLVDLVACTVNDQLSLVSPYLRNEVILDSNGDPEGYMENSSDFYNPTSEPTTDAGIRADGATPIAASLEDIRAQFATLWSTVISLQTVKQSTYAIILTDGDDTCAADSNATSNEANDNALTAAYQAELLYDRISALDPESSVTTFIVAFGAGASKARADWIAYGGSGMDSDSTDTSFSNDGTQWTGIPTAADVAACTTCREAFYATNADALAAALRSALSAATSTGSFSTTANTLATVFELGPQANAVDCVDFGEPNPDGKTICADPLNPNSRYRNTATSVYQSTLQMPSFEGHLFTFVNQAGSPLVQLADYDAGQALYDSVTAVLQASAGAAGTNLFTFDELKGDATARDIETSSAVLKRRIFTNSPTPPAGGGSCTGTPGYNCTYTRDITVINDWDQALAQGSNVVALWPPDQTDLNSGAADVDPAVGTEGPFDDILGIGSGADPVLSFAELRSRFGACEGSADTGGVPTDCDNIVDATLALNTARKEARQIILAYTAGAQLTTGSDGFPLRVDDDADPLTLDPLLYTSRDWLLLDSTLSQPAVSSPPLRNTPDSHIREWLLYRDGRRGADRQGIDEISQGFGLRNPDFDDDSPETKLDLKPVMSVVYLGANDGLHAFRAGPNCGDDDYTTCNEIGLQELWNYVPFDQLGKLATLASSGQARDPHVYVIASSPRMADIFVPGNFTLGGVTYEGRWRNVLVFGRGPGGKFYTMLDITAPGPFTALSLETNPPFVMWNHGNEDGVLDLYDGMGQTWSIPAIGFLGAGSSPEWAVWAGSGYGETSSEGKTFYMLDAVTGNISLAVNVGDGDTTHVANNALVAPPTLYNPFTLDPPGTVNRSIDQVTRAYIPDVHGRIWKFDTGGGGILKNLGAGQPFANAVALLALNSGSGTRPQVYAEAGNDSRVPLVNLVGSRFKMFGIEDPAGPSDYTADQGIVNFEQEFDDNGLSETGFRGTVQPATAFNAEGNGRVFFAGTRFNPSGTDCVSSFDTILFALGALSGDAAYDFNSDNTADLATLIAGERTTGLQTAGGQLVMGGSGAQGAPPDASLNDPVAPTPSAPAAAIINTTSLLMGGHNCRDY